MLKQEIKQQWIEALRSGEYTQCKEVLRSIKENGEGFCCLGVLCDISKVGEWRQTRHISYRYYDQNEEEGFSYPPGGVIALALQEPHEDSLISDLQDSEGFTRIIHQWKPDKSIDYLITTSVFGGLTMMNDNGATFEEIADVIEKYL